MIDAAPTAGAATSSTPTASHHCRKDFLFRGMQLLKGEPFSPAALDVPAWQVRNLERTHIAIGAASDRLQLEAMERREKLEAEKARAAAKLKAAKAIAKPSDIETAETIDAETHESPRGGRRKR